MIKMKNMEIEIKSTNKKEEETKMTKIKNIEMAKRIILEELSYITESYFYMEESYRNMRSNFPWTDHHSDKLHYLRSVRENLNKGIERIYDARVEIGVSEEELGREIDERMIKLYQKSFHVDREIEKYEAAINAKNAAAVEAEILEEKEEEQKMENIENKINNILQIAGEQVDEIREIIRSLDFDRSKKFNSYIERQEDFLTSEMNKKYSFKMTVEILKYALEEVEKVMVEDGKKLIYFDGIELIDLSTDTQMKINAAERRLEDAKANRKTNLKKIRTTENILEKERRKEEKERRKEEEERRKK